MWKGISCLRKAALDKGEANPLVSRRIEIRDVALAALVVPAAGPSEAPMTPLAASTG